MTDPRKRILLDRLPALLQGYGKTYQEVDNVVIVVVVDLDRKNCVEFKNELLDVLKSCNPKPLTLFRIAIEECEAWLMGDRKAVKCAYPGVNESILDSYSQDSICGTWEKLADAVYPGGSKKIKKLGYPEIGKVKCEWAEKIAPNIDIDNNHSKSFQVFYSGIRRFIL